jgi:hypothetical protein
LDLTNCHLFSQSPTWLSLPTPEVSWGQLIESYKSTQVFYLVEILTGDLSWCLQFTGSLRPGKDGTQNWLCTLVSKGFKPCLLLHKATSSCHHFHFSLRRVDYQFWNSFKNSLSEHSSEA